MYIKYIEIENWIECILSWISHAIRHVPLTARLVRQEALRCLGCLCLWCPVRLRREVI